MRSPLETIDPLGLCSQLWPHYNFYDKQREIIYSMVYNRVTIVPAGNKLGKDFVAGFLAPVNFIAAKRLGMTCRGITTSVKDDHLRVLWGEIGRFVRDSRVPLIYHQGGPLVFNHRDIRWAPNGRIDDISYVRGMVSEHGEGMAGHHADWTFGIIDEASGVDPQVFDHMRTWAKRILIIGNPNPCPPDHFFYEGVKKGDLAVDDTMAGKLLEV